MKQAKRIYYSIKEVSALLEVHPSKVRRLITSGYIKAVNIGPKLIRIPDAELQNYIDELAEFQAEYFSIKEAAARLRVTKTTITNWINSRLLHAYKFAFEPTGVTKIDCYEIDPGARQLPNAA